MLKRLYEVIDGTPRLCDGVDYHKEMFNLQVDNNIYFNPFAHLLTSDFTFTYHEQYRYSVKIKTFNGVCFVYVSNGGKLVMDEMIRDFYTFYKFQIKYYNEFGITLIEQLIDIKVVNDEDMRRYCSVIFFPPILTDRTEWDYSEPDDELNILGVYDREKNPGGWTDVIYNQDGTYTFVPTKIQDIPVDPKNTQAVLLKQKLLKQQQDELHSIKKRRRNKKG